MGSLQVLDKIKQSARFIYQVVRSHSPRVAYIGGWSGHLNLGDEAVYIAMRGFFPAGSFIDYPRGFEPAIANSFLSRIRLGILAGGTLIGPKISTTTHAERLLAGCPDSIIFGSGVVHPSQKPVGPKFYDWPAWREKWRQILKSCRYVGVRGPLSAEVIADSGKFTPEVIGDPVLFFADDHIDSPVCEQNTIGFNVGQNKGFIWGDADNISRQFIEIASAARKAGWRVKWFVVWPDDLPVTEKAAIASRTEGEIYKVYRDPFKFLDLVKQLTVFVGTKLHSVALAGCAYVPSVMVEYQTKCRDYMMSIGQEQFCIRPEGAFAPAAWEKVRWLGENRRQYRDNLFRGIQQLRKRQVARAAELSEKYLMS